MKLHYQSERYSKYGTCLHCGMSASQQRHCGHSSPRLESNTPFHQHLHKPLLIDSSQDKCSYATISIGTVLYSSSPRDDELRLINTKIVAAPPASCCNFVEVSIHPLQTSVQTPSLQVRNQSILHQLHQVKRQPEMLLTTKYSKLNSSSQKQSVGIPPAIGSAATFCTGCGSVVVCNLAVVHSCECCVVHHLATKHHSIDDVVVSCLHARFHFTLQVRVGELRMWCAGQWMCVSSSHHPAW